MTQKRVKSLQELAAGGVYEEIISTLNDDEDLSQILRRRLDEVLIGVYSPVRHGIVKRFIKSHNSSRNRREVNSDFCLTFFNCLMDESFQSFDLTGGEEEDHPFNLINQLELVQIISKRSSHLQKVKLSFGFTWKTVHFLPTIGETLKSFNCLTSLNISWFTGSRIKGADFIPFFAALGELNLTSLQIRGDIPFEMDQLLAFALGKRRQLIPQSLLDKITNENCNHLQFSCESLNPICSSLRQLKVAMRGMSPTLFLLRHFRQLIQCQSAALTGAVQLLHQQQINQPEDGISFHRSSEVLGAIQWTNNAPFNGKISSAFNIMMAI